MLTLLHALQEEDADHWRVIAQAWGVEYPESARDPLAELIVAILHPERVAAMHRALPQPARDAVDALRRSGGRMPVAEFFHRFGEIRSMGSARRQREQPWRSPVSVSEQLWYSAWVGRAFFRAGSGTQEYIFLPGDLETLIPAGKSEAESYGPVLSYRPDRHETFYHAGPRAAEDVCTILAFLRNWPQEGRRKIDRWVNHKPLLLHTKETESLSLLEFLLREKGLLGGDPLQPDPETARVFLEMTAEEAAAALLKWWRDSTAWNDLERSGEVTAEGDWPNHPLRARGNFLGGLRTLPRGEWCTIDSTIAMLRDRFMEFLRPASEFHAWMLRDRSGDFLSGIESWDHVEGALARFLITGPLAWLGALDLAPAEHPKAFRITPLASVLWDEESTTERTKEIRPRIKTEGLILVASGTSMLLRYQLARCSDWLGLKGGAYRYRITPQALLRAREQGIRVSHILPLLENLFQKVPESFASALRRWEQKGVEVSIRSEQVVFAHGSQAADKIEMLSKGDRKLLTRLEGPVYLVSPLSLNRLRSRLVDNGFLPEVEEE